MEDFLQIIRRAFFLIYQNPKLKRFYKYYGKDGATLSNSYNLEEWREASGLQNKLNGETAENENEKAETTETEEGIQY